MRLSSLFVAAVSASAVSGDALTPRQEVDQVEEISSFDPTDDIAKLAAQGLEQIQEYEASRIASRSTTCSIRDVFIR
jgi:hypothetical protein